MNVLLLGAKGMLGSDLAQVFANEGLTAWDRDDIDITDAEDTMKKISEISPKFLINAAAFTDVDGSESDREAAFAVNEKGVANVAAAAKEVGATVIHYSTDYVFSGTSKDGYSEDDIPGPAVNAYGESKLAGEQALEASGVPYYLIRTAWLYGSQAEPTEHKNFVATIIRLCGERDEIGIVNDQHGSPTYTRDLAEATQQLLGGDFQPGTYHLVNGEQTTWYEFARAIAQGIGSDAQVNSITSAEYPLPATRPEYSVLNNTKGPALRPWQEALTAYLQARDE